MKYRKIRQGIILMGLICIVSGCGIKNRENKPESAKNEPIVMESKNEKGESVYEWHIDVTQDGTPERIVVNTGPLYRYPEGDELTISIYSGKTGALIWSDVVSSIAHMTWDGVYLYNENEKDYLMTWNPYMSQGHAVYRYRIFSLTESGEEIEIINEAFCYTDIEVAEADVEDLTRFADEVNEYLAKSFVLAACTPGMTGKSYSTDKEKTVSLYDPSDDLEVMKQIIARREK